MILLAVATASPDTTILPRMKISPRIPATMMIRYSTPPIRAYVRGEASTAWFDIFPLPYNLYGEAVAILHGGEEALVEWLGTASAHDPIPKPSAVPAAGCRGAQGAPGERRRHAGSV